MAERPEDLNLPLSVITRIIKEALPDGVNVSKDARLAVAKAASIFVLYATSCANNFAMQHKRKTISGNDVLEAMDEMEFERFVEPLKDSLQAYKDQQKGKKDASEQKKKAKEATAEESKDGAEEEKEEEEEDDEMEEEESRGEGDEEEPIVITNGEDDEES